MQGKTSSVDYSLWQLDSERKEMGSQREEGLSLQTRSRFIQDSR